MPDPLGCAAFSYCWGGGGGREHRGMTKSHSQHRGCQATRRHHRETIGARAKIAAAPRPPGRGGREEAQHRMVVKPQAPTGRSSTQNQAPEVPLKEDAHAAGPPVKERMPLLIPPRKASPPHAGWGEGEHYIPQILPPAPLSPHPCSPHLGPFYPAPLGSNNGKLQQISPRNAAPVLAKTEETRSRLEGDFNFLL